MGKNSTTDRIFFALLPDADTISAIETHAVQFSPQLGKKVKTENYHITLLFLGNVDRKIIDALCMDCDGIQEHAFELTIDRFGWFRKAKILWLGPEITPAPLASLVSTLGSIASRRRLAGENQKYIPHVTLMRKVTQAPEYPVLTPFSWQADSFSLMQSITHPGGVEYRELASWPLVT